MVVSAVFTDVAASNLVLAPRTVAQQIRMSSLLDLEPHKFIIFDTN